MAEIIWTQEAACWLHDIHDYIAQDNPQTAAKVIGGIFEKTQILQHYPEIGQKYRVEPEGEIRICILWSLPDYIPAAAIASYRYFRGVS